MTNAKAKNPAASSDGLRSRQPEDSANTVDLGNENANGGAKDGGMMSNGLGSIAKKIGGLVMYTIAVCMVTIYVVGGNGGVEVGQGLNSGLQTAQIGIVGKLGEYTGEIRPCADTNQYERGSHHCIYSDGSMTKAWFILNNADKAQLMEKSSDYSKFRNLRRAVRN